MNPMFRDSHHKTMRSLPDGAEAESCQLFDNRSGLAGSIPDLSPKDRVLLREDTPATRPGLLP